MPVDDFVTILSANGAAITAGRKNPFLNDLVASVDNCLTIYRTHGSEDRKVRALDDIMLKAAFWLTSRPPKTVGKSGAVSVKNPARWDAMTNLAVRVAQEAQLVGVKLLHSPTDFRTIAGDANLGRQSYWLERADQHHRPGYILSQHYENWVRQIDTTVSFWTYVDNIAPAGTYATPRVAFYGPHNVPAMLHYQVRVANDGVAWHATVPFNTQLERTEFSGPGFAIFVCDSFDMYAASHMIGQFHHSTFFAGMPVVAAGEIVAEHGTVKLITAKSGHYRPSADDMTRMVKKLAWIHDTAMIIPAFAPGNLRCYYVQDYRRDDTGSPVPKDQFKGGLPNWARNVAAITNIYNRLT